MSGTTRLALVANPLARSVDPEACADALQAEGARVEVFALRDAERAAASGADRLVVAGGDGSVAPAASAAGAADLSLAVIPAGTANDFARAMGLPLGRAEAARLAVHGTELRALELGRIDGRPFVNVASAGLAVPAAERARGWKRRLGPLAYAVGAVGAGASAKPLRCRATADGARVFEGKAWLVTVGCSGAFGAGSSLGVTDPADGTLDVVVIEAGSRAGLVARAYGLRSGRIASQRGVHHGRGRSVDVDVPPGTFFNVDGELCPQGPARLEVERSAFRLVVA